MLKISDFYFFSFEQKLSLKMFQAEVQNFGTHVCRDDMLIRIKTEISSF